MAIGAKAGATAYKNASCRRRLAAFAGTPLSLPRAADTAAAVSVHVNQRANRFRCCRTHRVIAPAMREALSLDRN
ncbi:hypothetical protein [Dokdonella ginsengisoli]|uniref:Uncharacterized protein n=1 Tax=Dokdonella ginsengisoli TaxID=363846 RepID=A0ABV9QV43_9GAMM